MFNACPPPGGIDHRFCSPNIPSPTHPLVQPCTGLFTPSLTCQPTWIIHTFTHSSAHFQFHTFTHSLTHTHSFKLIHIFLSTHHAHLRITHSPAHLLNYSHIYSHLSNHPHGHSLIHNGIDHSFRNSQFRIFPHPRTHLFNHTKNYSHIHSPKDTFTHPLTQLFIYLYKFVYTNIDALLHSIIHRDIAHSFTHP